MALAKFLVIVGTHKKKLRYRGTYIMTKWNEISYFKITRLLNANVPVISLNPLLPWQKIAVHWKFHIFSPKLFYISWTIPLLFCSIQKSKFLPSNKSLQNQSDNKNLQKYNKDTICAISILSFSRAFLIASCSLSSRLFSRIINPSLICSSEHLSFSMRYRSLSFFLNYIVLNHRFFLNFFTIISNCPKSRKIRSFYNNSLNFPQNAIFKQVFK